MVAPAPSDLAGWIASWYQTPIARVTVAGRVALRVTDVGVELGYDQQSAAATVTVSSPTIPTWAPGDSVVVELGFAGSGGRLQRVFAGEVEDVDLSWFPHRVQVRAAGYLRRLQLRYADPLEWTEIDDGDLWTDLMRRAGVPRYTDTAGEGITYGTRAPVTLAAGEPPRELVDRLDQSSPTGMRTFEVGGVVQRAPVLGIPANTPAHRYAEGILAIGGRLHPLELRRTDSIAQLSNRAVVSGLPSGGDSETNYADRRADSPYVPVDADGNPRDVTFSFSSDLLEYREQCDDVAVRYLTELNRRTDTLNLRAPLNPLLVPGQTVEVSSPKLNLGNPRNYFVRHVRHSYAASGAFTEAVLEGGAGESGYLVGLDPVAVIAATITAEVQLVGGVLQRIYTVHFDGSQSYDPDGTIVSYDWSLSTGPTGSGVTFAASFTEAQWSAGPEVTLTVTDDDDDPTGPHTNSVTEPVSGETTEVLIRTLYVAASSQAEASGDGGLTWGTWAPGSGVTVRSTPEIAPESGSYFGLSDGRLLGTTDCLATAPTLIHTFPASVECVWCNEADAARVWVGLANGDVWFTAEATAGAGAAWVLRAHFGSAVNWLVESYATPGEVRACVGTTVYLTSDGFAHFHALVTLGSGVARNSALSFFGNYASGTAADPVVTEAGVVVSFPGTPPADARITAFAKSDGLLAVDGSGAAWVKGPGATAFVAAAPTGAGAAGHVVRDGEQSAVFYAASADALVKTFDAAASWVALRDYAGSSLVGLQVGYAAAPMTPPVRWRYVERSSTLNEALAPPDNGAIRASVASNGSTGGHDAPPAGWTDPDFDTSEPWTGGLGASHPWGDATDAISFGANHRFFRAWELWASTAAGSVLTRNPEFALYRHTFTIPDPGTDGPWDTCLLESYGMWSDAGGDLINATPLEVYLNGHAVPLGGGSGLLGFAYVDPDWLVADGTSPNVIAVRAVSHAGSGLSGKRCAWKLTVTNHPDVVSLETTGDGAVYWRPTGECLRTVYAVGDAGPPAGWNGPATAGELPSPARYRTFNSTGLGGVGGSFTDPLVGPVAAPGTVDALPADDFATATWRHPCKLPPSSSGGPYRRVTLTLALPSTTSTFRSQRTRGVWLNGQLLDARDTGAYEVDPTLLVPGDWNVLCLQAGPSGVADQWNGYVGYLIRIEP